MLREDISKLTEKVPTACFQCGECSSICPIGRINPKYSPRKIIHEVVRGFDRILSSEEIWLCCSCYSCNDTCPQDVGTTDIIIGTKNIAAQKGFVPKNVKAQIKAIIETGHVLPIIGRAKKIKSDMALPEIEKVDTGEIRKITNLDRFLS